MDDGLTARGKTPLHLPLSRYFLPQVCAYIVAQQLDWTLNRWLWLAFIIGMGGLLVERIYAYRTGSAAVVGGGYNPLLKSRYAWRRIWLFVLGAALFAAWFQWRVGTAESVAVRAPFPWPASETSMEIEVERLWTSASVERIAGKGRVIAAPVHARVDPGERIAFDAWSPLAWEALPWVGSRIRLRGVRSAIESPPEWEDLAPFDQWLLEQGVHFRLSQATVLEVIEHVPPSWPERANARFEALLRRGLPPDSELANVYVAMLLGKRVALSSEQMDAFRETGTMHFFAISGLHIGTIATILFFLLKYLRFKRWQAAIIGLSMLAAYVVITGSSPSAVRAFLMASFFWIGLSVARQWSSMAAWMNAAFVVLLIQPTALFMTGFQLSYAVVASIVLFGLPMRRLLLGHFNWRLALSLPEPLDRWRRLLGWLYWTVNWAVNWTLNFLLTGFCVSLSAWLASTPLILIHFNLLVPGAILLNIPLVFFCMITLAAGVGSLLTGLLGLGMLGILFNQVASLMLGLMVWVVKVGHSLTWIAGKTLNTQYDWVALAALVGFLLLAWQREKKQTCGGPERTLGSFLPAVFLLALGCAIVIVSGYGF